MTRKGQKTSQKVYFGSNFGKKFLFWQKFGSKFKKFGQKCLENVKK